MLLKSELVPTQYKRTFLDHVIHRAAQLSSQLVSVTACKYIRERIFYTKSENENSESQFFFIFRPEKFEKTEFFFCRTNMISLGLFSAAVM